MSGRRRWQQRRASYINSTSIILVFIVFSCLFSALTLQKNKQKLLHCKLLCTTLMQKKKKLNLFDTPKYLTGSSRKNSIPPSRIP